MLRSLSRALACALAHDWNPSCPSIVRNGWSPRAERRRTARRATYRTDNAGVVRRTTPKRTRRCS